MALLNRRVHVGPHDWDNGGATDYWLQPLISGQVAVASATNPFGLSGWGWVTTALTVVAGTAGDLNSSGDYTPTAINFNSAADLLQSARIFGGYDQFQRVSDILLYTPTLLVCDFYAAFSTITANETTTFVGMSGNITDAAAAASAGCITASGAAPPTNFFLTSDTGSDQGAAIDAAWHRFRIEYGTTNTEWFIDGVSQGTIVTEIDIWPVNFVGFAGATNRMSLGWTHIYYR